MRTHTLKRIAAALITVMLVVGCGQSEKDEKDEKDSAQKEEKTFIIARSTDAQYLDAGYAWSEGEIDLMYHLYDGLVRYKNDELEVEPALATDWELTEDGTVWTFKLREDVTFHDGSAFNAEAVQFSFMRLIDEDHEYYGMGDYSYFDYLLSDVIEDIKVVDEYTVAFHLKNKFAPFLTYMGYYSQYPVSMEGIKKHGEDFSKNPSGTGPFKLVEWKEDEYITLEANENYWGEKPKIDKLIWKVVPDISTRFLELQSGQAHAVKGLAPNQLEKVKSSSNLDLHQVPGANIFQMTFNNESEPVNNKLVRQAIAYAIDKETLVEGVYEGLGTPAVSSVPPTVFGFNDQIEPYGHDPERARELLKEAGYPDGVSITLNTFIHARPYVSNPVDSAEIIKDNLSDAGIDATIVTNEWGTHSSLMRSGDYQAGFSGWYDVAYPSNFLKTMLLEGSNANWHPEEMVELAQQALATYDRDEQIRIYHKMQEIEHEEVPTIPIAHNDYTAASSADIKGFRLDIVGNIIATDVEME